ncbi:DUF3817 domain-containing protein [Nocardia sp. NPDC057440]|uniref:DUF3817 domain-containing protein n=1 Tax=Nocardia sp. NPDC057440 TaxID=3346134 RepID=UPI003673183B
MTTSENSTEPTLTESAPSAAVVPANTGKIASALLRYRVLAWVTGLWLLLLTGEIIAKYGFDVHTPSWIAVVHGWVYFAYLLVTADLAVKVRWPLLRTVGTLIAGTVPLLSFFVEHVNAKKVKAEFNL